MSSSERSATCVVNRRGDGHRLQCRGSCFLRVPWMMAALLAWCSSVPAQSLHCRTLAAESPVLGVIQYACGDSALHGLLHFASCCCDKSLATRFGCLKLGPRLTESNIECVILAGSSRSTQVHTSKQMRTCQSIDWWMMRADFAPQTGGLVVETRSDFQANGPLRPSKPQKFSGGLAPLALAARPHRVGAT